MAHAIRFGGLTDELVAVITAIPKVGRAKLLQVLDIR